MNLDSLIDRRHLRARLAQPDFTAGEAMKGGFQLFKSRFKDFFLLTLLVYLPIQLAIQYRSGTLDLMTEDLSVLAYQLLQILILQIILSFLELVALLVASVFSEHYISPPAEGEEAEKPFPFSTAFYRGIRMWPRALVTYGFVVLGLVMIVVLISVFANLFLLILLPVILLIVVWFTMYKSFACTSAALRARFGFDALRYCSYINSGYLIKSLALFGLVALITEISSLFLSLFLDLILSLFSLGWLSFGLRVVFLTLFSIVNIYGYICGALWFMHLEHMKMIQEEQTAE